MPTSTSEPTTVQRLTNNLKRLARGVLTAQSKDSLIELILSTKRQNKIPNDNNMPWLEIEGWDDIELQLKEYGIDFTPELYATWKQEYEERRGKKVEPTIFIPQSWWAKLPVISSIIAWYYSNPAEKRTTLGNWLFGFLAGVAGGGAVATNIIIPIIAASTAATGVAAISTGGAAAIVVVSSLLVGVIAGFAYVKVMEYFKNSEDNRSKKLIDLVNVIADKNHIPHSNNNQPTLISTQSNETSKDYKSLYKEKKLENQALKNELIEAKYQVELAKVQTQLNLANNSLYGGNKFTLYRDNSDPPNRDAEDIAGTTAKLPIKPSMNTTGQND